MTRNHGTTNTAANAARNAAMKEVSNKGEAAAAAIIRAGGTVDEAKDAMTKIIRAEMKAYDDGVFLTSMRDWRLSLDHVATADEILAEVDRFEAARND